jgi:hypothetical protein
MTISRLFGATMVAGAPATRRAAAKDAAAATEEYRSDDPGPDTDLGKAPAAKPDYARAVAA